MRTDDRAQLCSAVRDEPGEPRRMFDGRMLGADRAHQKRGKTRAAPIEQL